MTETPDNRKNGVPGEDGEPLDSFDDSDFSRSGEVPDGDGKDLSFLGHFAELRSRLIKGILVVIPFVLLAYEFSGAVLAFLSAPLVSLMPPGQGLIATTLPETFLIHLKISLWGGLFASSPFWLYQVWAFVAPGLYEKERASVAKLTGMAFALLLLGGAFAYYVAIPLGFKFFIGFGAGTVTILPVIHEYLSLVMTLILAFGCAFELPLLLMFLAAAGLVDSKKLARFRQYAILIIVTLAAFLTPPDVISQILMAVPMCGLYELSVFLIRRKEKESGVSEENGKSPKETKEEKKANRIKTREEKKSNKIKLREEKKANKIKIREEKKANKIKFREEKKANKIKIREEKKAKQSVL
ncbi:MAG: twin-arginine translocase subunit TatC [Deltaproteobacteria bacterium]|jgi:sec-independent protein translocase protein TatC|nr:twin-arginine translocase subunit TatC [Deltaproteobacteria bacterium]